MIFASPFCVPILSNCHELIKYQFDKFQAPTQSTGPTDDMCNADPSTSSMVKYPIQNLQVIIPVLAVCSWSRIKFKCGATFFV